MADRPPQKGNKDKGGPSQVSPDNIVSKRLRERAVSKGNLASGKATPAGSLVPSKAILKCNGKDIVKRGHRKSKYLFAFPGLFAPVARGVLGELAQLDSKNPVMYIDFPEGRLKLFGTLVYPKNKYLTLHFSKGAGHIACEDCFENMVVFSDCWWVGRKEENPSEARMDMPESMVKRQPNEQYDFTGGAGRQPETVARDAAAATTSKLNVPVDGDLKDGTPGADQSQSDTDNDQEGLGEGPSTSQRKSSRSAGRTFRFAEPGTDDELDDDDADSGSDDDVPLRRAFKRPKVQSQPREKEKAALAGNPVARDRITINLDSDEDEKEVTTAKPRSGPQRNKRQAAGSAPMSNKRKKRQKENEEEESNESSREDLPSDPSSEDDESDEDFNL